MSHIVIGIVNEDEQVRHEKEWRSRLKNVKTLARIDRLTGVYNKNAFEQERRAMNRKIKAGKAQFAIVVCDANNLKAINDASGHLAGDVYLKEGAQRLAKTFAPTKVFRIGGDEFAVILQGKTYQNRMYLLSSLMNSAFKDQKNGKHTMAVGMSDFNPEVDHTFSAVFVRADAAMYENKRKMKNG